MPTFLQHGLVFLQTGQGQAHNLHLYFGYLLMFYRRLMEVQLTSQLFPDNNRLMHRDLHLLLNP